MSEVRMGGSLQRIVAWPSQLSSLTLMAIFGKDLEKIGKMENNVEKTHDTIFFCLSGNHVLKPSILTYYFWKTHFHCSSCQNHCWASSCYKCGESFFTSDWSKFCHLWILCRVFFKMQHMDDYDLRIFAACVMCGCSLGDESITDSWTWYVGILLRAVALSNTSLRCYGAVALKVDAMRWPLPWQI